MRISHKRDHRPARAANYPDIGEQLDVIWKQIAALPADQIIPESLQMLEKIRTVKQFYRKPSQ